MDNAYTVAVRNTVLGLLSREAARNADFELWYNHAKPLPNPTALIRKGIKKGYAPYAIFVEIIMRRDKAFTRDETARTSKRKEVRPMHSSRIVMS